MHVKISNIKENIPYQDTDSLHHEQHLHKKKVINTNSKWFDPNHPDADWSGFVPARQSRKHPEKTPPAMQEQLKASNGIGICPREDARTEEWTKPRLKVQFESNSDCRKKTAYDKTSTFSLIGGPIPATDPASVTSKGWETETQAAMKQTGTKVRQLTTYGRSIHIRGKKETVPAFELAANGFDEEKHLIIRKENPYALNCDNDAFLRKNEMEQIKKESTPNSSDTKFIGYRSHQGGAAKSFLVEIGKQIADKVEAKPSVIVAPFATEGNLPTDPYLNAKGERRKDLLLENYSIALPGYTGTPSFIKPS